MLVLKVTGVFLKHATAWVYLVGFVTGDLVYSAQSPGGRSTLVAWASTNVANLRHDPVGSLVASAFIPSGVTVAWPPLIALTMFAAVRVAGNGRTALVCVAGHVVGTLISEGIVAYRIAHGALPRSQSHISDVGPSYIVVSALVIALLYGSWIVRALAAAEMALLIFVGGIFGGLSTLDVAAVGHVTAMIVAALLAALLVWRRKRRDSIEPARAFPLPLP